MRTRATAMRSAIIGAAVAALVASGPGPAAAEDNVAGTSGPAASVRWTVDEVVRIALEENPQVNQADSDTRAAGARKGQAASGYYPSVGVAAGVGRSRSFSASTGRSATADTEFVQGTLSQTITDFGRTGAGVDRAGALFDAARESGRSVRGDVALQAKTAYFNVLRTRQVLAVQRETVAQRESLLKQAQAFYEAGIRARIDVARAEAALYQARADLTTAESDVRVARITLLNRMGIDGPRDFDLADALAQEKVPGTLDERIREAERNRPELRALIAREQAAESAVRAARAGYYPILSGTAGYGYEADQPPLRENYAVAVQVSVPLFTGFLTREQVREAEASLASARFAVTDFRRAVRLQVEQASLSVQEASDRTDARRKEKAASEENLRLATGRYEVGAGDIIEMIDAQVQAAAAEATYIQALYDYSTSVASLLRVMGR